MSDSLEYKIEGGEKLGPYVVLQFDERSALCAGDWGVHSDRSSHVAVFPTKEEAMACARRRYRAFLRRRLKQAENPL